MSRTFVMGDIHGAFRALKQCLERASFDYEHDRLIALGDVCDGWPETKECIDELLKIKNLIFILGNHDSLLLHWMETGKIADGWFLHGGEASCKSYGNYIPGFHLNFLRDAALYHLEDNSLFVHAGIIPGQNLDSQGPSIFLWDRTLANLVIDFRSRGINERITQFNEIYIGHTPIASPHPIKCCEVWMMDTGAGWSGPLSMMDVNTKEFFISDTVASLYPGVSGRTR